MISIQKYTSKHEIEEKNSVYQKSSMRCRPKGLYKVGIFSTAFTKCEKGIYKFGII